MAESLGSGKWASDVICEWIRCISESTHTHITGHVDTVTLRVTVEGLHDGMGIGEGKECREGGECGLLHVEGDGAGFKWGYGRFVDPD